MRIQGMPWSLGAELRTLLEASFLNEASVQSDRCLQIQRTHSRASASAKSTSAHRGVLLMVARIRVWTSCQLAIR